MCFFYYLRQNAKSHSAVMVLQWGNVIVAKSQVGLGVDLFDIQRKH